MSLPLNRQELISIFRIAVDQQGAIQAAKNYLSLLLQQQAAQSSFGVIGNTLNINNKNTLLAIRADGMVQLLNQDGSKNNFSLLNIKHNDHISICNLTDVLQNGEPLNYQYHFFNSQDNNVNFSEMEDWGKEGLENIREGKVVYD